MSGYKYAGTKSTPSVSGNTGNGTVTYYYNTTNSNSGGTAWSSVNSSTKLNAGTYYMYAVVAATTNYEGATTAAKAFTIDRASGYVNLSSTSTNVYVGTDTTSFTISSHHGGNLSATTSNCSASISGTTVSVSGLSSLAIGAKATVTITSGQVTNYNAATATFTITIIDLPYTGISKGSYSAGQTVSYSGLNWKVISDNGSNVTMVLASNYTTGAFSSSSASFTSGNNAFDQVNTNFVNAYSVLKNDINNGGIVYDSSSSSYVRIPKQSELSSNISNSSGTNFWTMTASGNNLYYGLSDGGKSYSTYSTSGSTGTLYNGYGTSSSSVYSTSLSTGVSSSTTSNPTAAYNATSARENGSGFGVGAAYFSGAKASGTPSKSTSPSSYTKYVSGAGMYCGSYTLSGSTCIYSCSYYTTEEKTISISSGSTSYSYCSNSGSSSFSGSYPSASRTNLYKADLSGTRNVPATATTTGSGAYSGTTYSCASSTTSSYSGNATFSCITWDGGDCGTLTSSGSTYYYATASGCSYRYDYTASNGNSSMGIRPVITVKEK